MTTVTAPPATPCTVATARAPGRVAAFLADPRRAVCAAVLAMTAVVGMDTLSDPDMWWHLRVGQWALTNFNIPKAELFSYTVAGQPRTPHEWFASVIFSVLNNAGGLLLLTLVVSAVTWSGFVATALRGRLRGAGPLAIALGLALGAKAAEPVLGTRPQVFTLALLCWALWIAETYFRRGGRRVWLLPPMFLVWANVHAGFVAGIGVMALIVVIEAAKRRFRFGELVDVERIRTLAIVTAVCALVACINPEGPQMYVFALVTGPMESAKGIIEWQSPNFHDPGMWALLALLVTFVAMPALGARLDPRDAALGAIGLGLGLLAVRNISICVALMTPAWIAMASDIAALRKGRPRLTIVTRRRVVTGAAIVGVGLLTVGYGATRVAADASPSGVAAAYPTCAVGVLARAPSPQRVFAEYGAAGYVVDTLWPHASVYLYGDSSVFNKMWFANYYRVASGTRVGPTALQLLDASNTTAVLYPAGDLTNDLDHTPGWTRVADDHGMLLYVRGDASWAAGATCAPGI